MLFVLNHIKITLCLFIKSHPYSVNTVFVNVQNIGVNHNETLIKSYLNEDNLLVIFLSI